MKFDNRVQGCELLKQEIDQHRPLGVEHAPLLFALYWFEKD
jgi:hypothetical protein